LEVELPPGVGMRLLGGVCRYGVIQRGQAEPFLLQYYPKAVVSDSLPEKGDSQAKLVRNGWDKLPLQVVAAGGRDVRVLWHGKALAGAEVVAHLPGQEKTLEGKTSEDGTFSLGSPGTTGLVGIRVSHVEEKAGELDGKKYKSVKHYAT